ncbi:MAG: hypothetical protein ACFFF9_15790 [Candidatus Thorarchaeota archaeon]
MGESCVQFGGGYTLYMVASLILLSVVSFVLAYLWHQRIKGFDTLLSSIKSKFDSDSVDSSRDRGYGQCISNNWVLDNIVRRKESRVGDSIRSFINERTVIGFFIMGILIHPVTAFLVVLFYRVFAILGVSIIVLIIAIFLVIASGNVKASHGLLSWLRTKDYTELNANDVVYAEVSFKTLTYWRRNLVAIALSSLMLAPWGELIPQGIALATSGFLITIFTLVYPPVAAISHELAIIMILYLIPLGVALLYLISRAANRVSAYLNGDLLRNL